MSRVVMEKKIVRKIVALKQTVINKRVQATLDAMPSYMRTPKGARALINCALQNVETNKQDKEFFNAWLVTAMELWVEVTRKI